jgi:hypothetical protein
MIFKIAGGTGRFQDATGMLTLNEITVPVLANASFSPVLFAATGEITGMISGLGRGEGRQDQQHE